MYSVNLSKLVTQEYFFEVMRDENLVFDWIISDRRFEIEQENLLLLDMPLPCLLAEKKIKKSDSVLLILDKIGISLIQNALGELENCTILNAYDGIASIAYKVAPELQSYKPLVESGFELYFPFDETQFLTALSKGGKKYFSLINQEIADNIYTIDEEEIAFIDKALAEQPTLIALINNPDAEHHIIMMGNYFEEAVKLSELLLADTQAYHFNLIGKWSEFASQQLRNQLKKAKKLTLIMDQELNSDFQTFFAREVWFDEKLISFITPEYRQMRSLLADYQYFECGFDAEGLSKRIW